MDIKSLMAKVVMAAMNTKDIAKKAKKAKKAKGDF